MEIIFLTGKICQKPVKKQSGLLSTGVLGKEYLQYKVECENDLTIERGKETTRAIYTVINFDTTKKYNYKNGQDVTVTGKFAARLYEDKNKKVHVKLFVFETYEMCFDGISASILIDEICNK